MQRLAGLIGGKLGHSLSPVLHDAAYRAMGLDWQYMLFEVAENNLGTAVKAVRAFNMAGCNVTVPYKEKVIPFLDELTEVSQRTGSVNTVCLRDGKLLGHSTDGEGFIGDLRSHAMLPAKNDLVCVFGCGGAGAAVADAALAAGCHNIVLCDMIVSKAELLKQKISVHYSDCIITAVAADNAVFEDYLREARLFVNASPCGMEGYAEGLFPVQPTMIRRDAFVYDLVYNPNPTPLVRECSNMGIKAATGLGMLVRQAALSIGMWSGMHAPIEVMAGAVTGGRRRD